MDIELKFRKFFSLVPERECGDCVSCCEIAGVDSPKLKKPAGVLCPNCATPGCSIYDTRPVVCRQYHCLWRQLDTLATDMRPEKSKVMFSLHYSVAPRNVFQKAFIVGATLESWEIFRTPAVEAAIDSLIRDFELPVWLSFQHQGKLVYPLPDMAQEIRHPGSAKSADVAADAKRWLARYEERASQLILEEGKFTAHKSFVVAKPLHRVQPPDRPNSGTGQPSSS
jgi:hypothetical protein